LIPLRPQSTWVCIEVVGDMAEDRSTARRVRVERNIYRCPSGLYEVGFNDGGGKQRWARLPAGSLPPGR
jgi:hypothetical protein